MTGSRPGPTQVLAADIEQYLQTQERRTFLRFMTCGSVDDGKSTLIGRLLYEANLLFEDQLAELATESKKVGTQRGDLDFALLLDGLTAEREQGITIDVAYRFFSTDKRKFIVADTPGHEQYTRNMMTAASNADVALLLVDARKGVVTQTKRHAYLASLVGIRHLALVVNKMDLVGYSSVRFKEIGNEFQVFARRIGLEHVLAIPVCAVKGENILLPSENMGWHYGSTVMGYLETVAVDEDRLRLAPFRLPVQWVNRPDSEFRGFAGTVVCGTIRPGDSICVKPSGQRSRVARIVTYEGDLAQAGSGQAITLTLTDDIDVSRGDVLCSPETPAGVADQFEATIVWMSDRPMLPSRSYWLKIGGKTVGAVLGHPKYRVNANTLEHLAARKLELNDIAVANVALDRPIAFDPYTTNRDTGGFILIDRFSHDTVGAGMLHFALRRSQNLHWQVTDVDRRARAAQKGQQACILWFTGLSGAGKSTIANIVERQLHARGRHTYLLDGDNLRHGLNRDLGFTEEDRVENIRRVAELARLMLDAGLIVLVSLISPFRAERRMARGLVGDGEFVEIFVDTPLAVAEQRDPKGLYGKARRGELKNFTGLDSPYETPDRPEIRIDTTVHTPERAADEVIATLVRRAIVDAPDPS
jgi:bifunctional enzyme CysN/CysC